MQSAVKKFGNSAGIVIPKPILNAVGAQAGDKIDISVEDGNIVVKLLPANPRQGWAEAAAAIAAAGDDTPVLGDFGNDSDETEWTW